MVGGSRLLLVGVFIEFAALQHQGLFRLLVVLAGVRRVGVELGGAVVGGDEVDSLSFGVPLSPDEALGGRQLTCHNRVTFTKQETITSQTSSNFVSPLEISYRATRDLKDS